MAVTIFLTCTHVVVFSDIIHIKLSAPARLDLQVQRFLGGLAIFKVIISLVVKHRT